MISQISSNIHIYIDKSQIFPQAKTNPPDKPLTIAQLNDGAVFLPNLIRLPFFTSFWTSFLTFLFIGTSLIMCCCQLHFVLVSQLLLSQGGGVASKDGDFEREAD